MAKDLNIGSNVNPYSAPMSSFSIDTTGNPQEDALRAFVGPNADGYLRKWAKVLNGSAGGTGFNWAAFFLSGLWITYRKMYRGTLIFYGIIMAELILDLIVVDVVFESPDAGAVIDRLSRLAVAIVCGVYGNRWYLSHTRNAIEEARREGLEGERLYHELSRRGGTNL